MPIRTESLAVKSITAEVLKRTGSVAVVGCTSFHPYLKTDVPLVTALPPLVAHDSTRPERFAKVQPTVHCTKYLPAVGIVNTPAL